MDATSNIDQDPKCPTYPIVWNGLRPTILDTNDHTCCQAFSRWAFSAIRTFFCLCQCDSSSIKVLSLFRACARYVWSHFHRGWKPLPREIDLKLMHWPFNFIKFHIGFQYRWRFQCSAKPPAEQDSSKWETRILRRDFSSRATRTYMLKYLHHIVLTSGMECCYGYAETISQTRQN